MTNKNCAARIEESASWMNLGAAAQAHLLAEQHTAEVLSFLDARPLDTVFVSGLIRDNGLVSPLNRGVFYGCRDPRGRLTGVGLIGHATFVEARTQEALRSLATIAQGCRSAHMILGESEVIQKFWHHYADGGRAPRLLSRELLFEKSGPTAVLENVNGLRAATESDLDLIVPVHAQMAFDESGVDPLERDAEGFRLRCARRIRQGRTWVVVEDGRLAFKAEVVAETPAVTYLEGIYVAAELRGSGFGLCCFTQLCRELLSRTSCIRLLVQEQNARAVRFYERAGFRLRGFYDTVFLQQEP